MSEWGQRGALLLVGVSAALSRTIVSLAQIGFGFRQILVGPFYFVPWADYYGIYLAQLAFMTKGVLPYVGFGYSYPPFFLYSMLPLYEIGGSLLPATLILAADASTAVVICLIVSERSTAGQGMLAGLAYALLPLALANEGYLWLSTQPMLFFSILSVYLLGHKRIVLSMVSLGVALMFKQEVILMAFPMLYLAFKDDFRAGLKGMGALLVTMGLASLPFLLMMPTYYLTEVTFGLARLLPPSAQPPLAPWNGVTFFGGVHACPGLCIVINTSQIQWNHFMAQLDFVLGWVIPFLIVLIVVAGYSVRRSPELPYIALAGSFIVFLYGFSLTLHPIFPYYTLPAYALFICAATNKSMLLASIAGSTFATFIAQANIQLLTLIVTFLVTVVVIDMNAQKPILIGGRRDVDGMTNLPE